jgi:hypothetical protein
MNIGQPYYIYKGLYWINLVQMRVKWLAVVKTVMNVRV